MAIFRHGFVSNSSSSSFLVAIRQEGEITKDSLLTLLGIPVDSHGAKFFEEIIEEIVAGEEPEEVKAKLKSQFKVPFEDKSWQFRKVYTDESEGIGSLGCDVVKVDYCEEY